MLLEKRVHAAAPANLSEPPAWCQDGSVMTDPLEINEGKAKLEVRSCGYIEKKENSLTLYHYLNWSQTFHLPKRRGAGSGGSNVHECYG